MEDPGVCLFKALSLALHPFLDVFRLPHLDYGRQPHERITLKISFAGSSTPKNDRLLMFTFLLFL